MHGPAYLQELQLVLSSLGLLNQFFSFLVHYIYTYILFFEYKFFYIHRHFFNEQGLHPWLHFPLKVKPISIQWYLYGVHVRETKLNQQH